MAGGGGGANREAKRAREDEEERQARIREGTSRIDEVFRGSSVGVNPIDLSGAAYDPNATY